MIIDLTLCGERGGGPVHGGGEYGVAAATFICARSDGPVHLIYSDEIPFPLRRYSDHQNIVFHECTPEALTDFVRSEFPSGMALFLPLPYKMLAEGKILTDRPVFHVIHGLRGIELRRLRKSGVPLRLTSMEPLSKRLKLSADTLLGSDDRNGNRQTPLPSPLDAVAALPRNHRIITVSEHTKFTIRLLMGAKSPDLITLPPLSPFIDEAGHQREPVATEKKCGLVMLSAERAEKNIERVLIALERWPALREVLNTEKVFITGTGVQHDAVAALRNDGLEVVETGYCSNEKLDQIMASTKVLLYPSLSEGYGIPPVAGLRHGLAPAVSGSTSMPGVLKDAAVYFNPLDIDEIAVRILQLMTDEYFRTDLVKRGKLRYLALQSETLQAWESYFSSLNN